MRCAALFVAAVLVGGCGGSRPTRYADVRACLSRAGIVGELGRKGNRVYEASIAFPGARGGSGMIFFGRSVGANKNALARARINGFKPETLGRTARVYWFSDPSPEDRARVARCF
jgi:hypothetical protein